MLVVAVCVVAFLGVAFFVPDFFGADFFDSDFFGADFGAAFAVDGCAVFVVAGFDAVAPSGTTVPSASGGDVGAALAAFFAGVTAGSCRRHGRWRPQCHRRRRTPRH